MIYLDSRNIPASDHCTVPERKTGIRGVIDTRGGGGAKHYLTKKIQNPGRIFNPASDLAQVNTVPPNVHRKMWLLFMKCSKWT